MVPEEEFNSLKRKLEQTEPELEKNQFIYF